MQRSILRSSKSDQLLCLPELMHLTVDRLGDSEHCPLHCSCGVMAASVLQNPVIDDLGLCAVLEGCRELRKLSLAHVHAGDRVMHMLATKSKQLEVRPPVKLPINCRLQEPDCADWMTAAAGPVSQHVSGFLPSPRKPSLLGCVCTSPPNGTEAASVACGNTVGHQNPDFA